MRHNIFWIYILVVLLVSGCSQEETSENGVFPSERRVFTASFESGDSRTQMEHGYWLRWTENDLISLFVSNTFNSQYRFDGKTGDNGGTFSMVDKEVGTGGRLNTNYAVYPYDPTMTISEDGVIAVTLPTEQSYAYSSFGIGDNPMVAVTEDADDTFLQFKNVGGYLKLQLYGENVTVKSIILTGNNNEKLSGKASVKAVYDEFPSVVMADDAAENIVLNCGEGVKIGSTADTSTAFWIVVPPTVFNEGITVTIKDINDRVYTQSTAKKLVIERNKVKRMVAKNLEDLEEKTDSFHKLPYPEYVMPSTEWGISMDEVKELMSDYKLIHQDSQKLVYENENPYIVMSYEFVSGKLYLTSRYSCDDNEIDYNSYIRYIHRSYQQVKEHGDSSYWDDETRTYMQITGVETATSKTNYTCFSWVGVDWIE